MPNLQRYLFKADLKCFIFMVRSPLTKSSYRLALRKNLMMCHIIKRQYGKMYPLVSQRRLVG